MPQGVRVVVIGEVNSLGWRKIFLLWSGRNHGPNSHSRNYIVPPCWRGRVRLTRGRLSVRWSMADSREAIDWLGVVWRAVVVLRREST